MGFVPVGHLDVVQPCLVELGLGLRRRSNSETLNGFSVSLGITTSLRLGDGSLQGFDRERNTAPSDEEQTIEPGASWADRKFRFGAKKWTEHEGKLTTVVLDVEVQLELRSIYWS